MLSIFGQTISDPVIREAVELQAYEEARHGRLLQHMLERYGIEVRSAPPSLEPVTRDDFLLFGFSECADSFVGFGGFALARRKHIFPKQLMDIFEHVLYEETRHIVFFINWWRYEEAIAGRMNPLERTARRTPLSRARGSEDGPRCARRGPDQPDRRFKGTFRGRHAQNVSRISFG
jgi:hypothetical protein